jgi:hypothetical protein
MLFCMVVAAVGCGPTQPNGAVSRTSQAIGYGINDSTGIFQAVVSVAGHQKFCTGTFIAPHFVLTAAHCFKCANLSTPGEGCHPGYPGAD